MLVRIADTNRKYASDDPLRQVHPAPTSKVPVELLSATTAVSAILVVGPVSHATELVALGEWGVGNAVEGGLGGNRGAPSALMLGQRVDQVDQGRLAWWWDSHVVLC